MASLLRLFALAAACVSALPGAPKLTDRQLHCHSLSVRQAAAVQAAGISDNDILQFALTLERLEGAFYQQGFQKFADGDFTALGLDGRQLADLKSILATEQQHVNLLQSALIQAGVQPVQPCDYGFNFTDARAMLATAAVLESVGLSAYLRAAPLISSPGLLGIAASILAVEARHQTALRAFTHAPAVPQALDVALGLRAILSLFKPFIRSCPPGSTLAVEPFPALGLQPGQVASPTIGDTLQLTADPAVLAAAKQCAFTSGSVLPGGTAFTPFSQSAGCKVPSGIGGVSYLTLASDSALNGTLTDSITLDGPMILLVT